MLAESKSVSYGQEDGMGDLCKLDRVSSMSSY